MGTSLPDRWVEYKPIGKKVEGTRFIAFKVPLKKNVSQNVDRKMLLDHSILLNKIPNLGLIIDLTNTYRYYDPTVFEKNGVKHKKIMIPGRETPCKYLRYKFNRIVEEFLEKNEDNDKLIGVHCTHGVNRTGYMICNYMISQMNIEPNEALDRFNNSRGHKVERTNYIDSLQNLFDSKMQSSSSKRENWREKKDYNAETNRSQSSSSTQDNWRKRRKENNTESDRSKSRKNSHNMYDEEQKSYKSDFKYQRYSGHRNDSRYENDNSYERDSTYRSHSRYKNHSSHESVSTHRNSSKSNTSKYTASR